MTIIRNENIVIYPTPEELADEFTNMDDSHQVRFLNAVASASERYGFQWCFQFQYITDHPDLTPKARAWMRELGEYAEDLSPSAGPAARLAPVTPYPTPTAGAPTSAPTDHAWTTKTTVPTCASSSGD